MIDYASKKTNKQPKNYEQILTCILVYVMQTGQVQG